MKLRRIVSLTSFLVFLLLLITGVVLFIVPQGRVAYWSEWRLWGLGKEDWAAVHILTSLLFLIAGITHVVLNVKPLLSYLRNRARQVRILTPEFAIALSLTTLFVVGAIFKLPPLRWVMDLNTYAKDSAAETLGEPPYGHAELSSLATFAQRLNMDLGKAKSLLADRGILVAADTERLVDIARANHRTPQALYQAMKGAEQPQSPGARQAPAKGLPAEPTPGLGRKTLAQLLGAHGLDTGAVVAKLAAKGIIAGPDETLRAIAERAGLGPHDLYASIRGIAQ